MYSPSVTLISKISGLEKRLFPWKASSLKPGRPVFFPGCNLVNFLPQTAQTAARVLQTQDCGWMFDCCGKPLSLKGDLAGSNQILARIEARIAEYQIPEMIVACPNCHQVFSQHLSIPVTNLYEYLWRVGHPSSLETSTFEVFTPCPDRSKGQIAASIEKLTGGTLMRSEGLPCCGLGMKQPSQAKKALATIQKSDPELKAYCASCYGHLSRNGVRITGHLLTEILGLEERPSAGIKKALNRLQPKFWE